MVAEILGNRIPKAIEKICQAAKPSGDLAPFEK